MVVVPYLLLLLLLLRQHAVAVAAAAAAAAASVACCCCCCHNSCCRGRCPCLLVPLPLLPPPLDRHALAAGWLVGAPAPSAAAAPNPSSSALSPSTPGHRHFAQGCVLRKGAGAGWCAAQRRLPVLCRWLCRRARAPACLIPRLLLRLGARLPALVPRTPHRTHTTPHLDPPFQADALVGVCRDAQRGCSETYTFDLERFGPPAGAVA